MQPNPAFELDLSWIGSTNEIWKSNQVLTILEWIKIRIQEIQDEAEVEATFSGNSSSDKIRWILKQKVDIIWILPNQISNPAWALDEDLRDKVKTRIAEFAQEAENMELSCTIDELWQFFSSKNWFKSKLDELIEELKTETLKPLDTSNIQCSIWVLNLIKSVRDNIKNIDNEASLANKNWSIVLEIIALTKKAIVIIELPSMVKHILTQDDKNWEKILQVLNAFKKTAEELLRWWFIEKLRGFISYNNWEWNKLEILIAFLEWRKNK